MPDINLLKKLCCAPGISGDEKEIRDIIINEIKDSADEYRVDPMGNILAFKKGRNKAEVKTLLSAHMDEVGFIVTDITSDGALKVEEVGGIDRRVIPGKQVTVGKNRVNGVFGIKPTHLLKPDEKDKIPKLDNMYIDIGAKDKEEAEKFVQPGDSVIFNSPFICDENRIIAKALDDRIGCLVLIDILKSDIEYDLYFSFVVQEEVGLRGAKAAAYTIDPQAAIVVEATTAADTAHTEEEKQVCKMGEGAVISFMDRRTIYDKEYYKAAFDVAKQSNVKIQPKKAVAGGNDAGVIHSSRGGVRTLAVSFPCRYIHSSASIIAVSDYKAVYTVARQTALAIAGGKV